KKILKTIGLTILSLFLLVILTVIIVLNSSFFQNKVVDWAGDFLKNRYDIELSVDDISFEPFNHLYIKKLLLSTGAVDSMIYVSEGQLDFNANPFRLLRGNFVLSGIDADSVKIRLVSNYTPRLEDTTGGAGFQFIFSPADIDVRHVDFRLQDTVRRMEVLAKSGRVQAKIHASNLQNEFTIQNNVLNAPAVTDFGAQKGSGEDPYIRKLWEDFRKANGIELSESERDTLFWDLSFDVNSLDVTNGSVNLYSYDSIGGGYKPPFSVSGITGHIGHVVTEPNHIVVGPFEAGFKMNDDLIVDQFSFDQLEMTDKFVRVRNLDLDYGQSKLGGELTFRYNTPSELGQFKDKVMIDIQIPQGRVYREDLVRLLPGMVGMSCMRRSVKDGV